MLERLRNEWKGRVTDWRLQESWRLAKSAPPKTALAVTILYPLGLYNVALRHTMRSYAACRTGNTKKYRCGQQVQALVSFVKLLDLLSRHVCPTLCNNYRTAKEIIIKSYRSVGQSWPKWTMRKACLFFQKFHFGNHSSDFGQVPPHVFWREANSQYGSITTLQKLGILKG